MFTGLIRTIILYLLIIAGIRLMGKRQVGELEPSELVLSLIIADLAAVPMQDFGIPLLTGIVPILTLLSLTMILSVLTMKSTRFRTLHPALGAGEAPPSEPAGAGGGGDRTAPGAHQRRKAPGPKPDRPGLRRGVAAKAALKARAEGAGPGVFDDGG